MGRKTLLMAGLCTEVCLAQTAISALTDGCRVFFVSDCSGGLTVESREVAKRRLVQVGATPINGVGVVCEWAHDFTSDERHWSTRRS
jgi:nicotinamidase-related amidase